MQWSSAYLVKTNTGHWIYLWYYWLESIICLYDEDGKTIGFNGNQHVEVDARMAKRRQSEGTFYEDGEDVMCPAGCGQQETCMNFLQCTTRHLQLGHDKHRGKFRKNHSQLRIAKVIYDCYMRISIALRCSDAPPSSSTYFYSEIDTLVNKAWLHSGQ